MRQDATEKRETRCSRWNRLRFTAHQHRVSRSAQRFAENDFHDALTACRSEGAIGGTSCSAACSKCLCLCSCLRSSAGSARCPALQALYARFRRLAPSGSQLKHPLNGARTPDITRLFASAAVPADNGRDGRHGRPFSG